MNLRTGVLLAATLGGCAEPRLPGEAPDLRHREMAPGPLHVVLVMDITNSWAQANFAQAREAALAFLGVLAPTAGPDDLVGMVVFTGRYGVEHTPMVPIVDAEALGVRGDWEALRTASKAGIQDPSGNCRVYPFANSRYSAPGPYPGGESSWPANLFSSVGIPPELPRTTQREAGEGGCYGNMWREYVDESGTDHTNGIVMAGTMFSEHPEPDVYRAMVLLTDGSPNGVGLHLARDLEGFVDDRWRHIRGPARTTTDVIAKTQQLTQRAWDRFEVSTWAVSFVAPATWLEDVVQGDGVYVQTNSASDLVPIYEDIAGSL